VVEREGSYFGVMGDDGKSAKFPSALYVVGAGGMGGVEKNRVLFQCPTLRRRGGFGGALGPYLSIPRPPPGRGHGVGHAKTLLKKGKERSRLDLSRPFSSILFISWL